MNKAELLRMLAEDYKKTVRLPDDISLKDYKDIIEHETGIKMSDKRATKALNDRAEFMSLLVVDRGTVIRVWRKKPQEKKNVQFRNTHGKKPNRTSRLSKTKRRSEVASSVSV